MRKNIMEFIDGKIEGIIDNIRDEKNIIMENVEFEEEIKKPESLDEIESYFFDRLKSRFKDICPVVVPNSKFISKLNKRVEHASKRLNDISENQKGRIGLNFHAGNEAGYWKGLKEGYEKSLEILREG